MRDFTRIYTQGLFVGLLALALLAPTRAMAQSNDGHFDAAEEAPAPATTTTTTYTTFNDGTYTYTTYSSEELRNYDLITSDRFGYGRERDLLAVDGGYNSDMMNNRVVIHLSASGFIDERLLPSDGFQRSLPEASPVDNFDPTELRIHTGTTVTFWSDDGHHALESVNTRIFEDSKPLVAGQIFSYTFLEPGRYRIQDGFGGGPVANEQQGLFIRVTGDSKTMGNLYPYPVGTVTRSIDVSQSTETIKTETFVEKQTPVESDIPTTVAPSSAPTSESAPAPPPVRVRDRDSK
jgi:hypothetical protein